MSIGALISEIISVQMRIRPAILSKAIGKL